MSFFTHRFIPLKMETSAQVIVRKIFGRKKMKRALYLALISAFMLVGCKDKIKEPEYEASLENQQDTIEGECFSDGFMSQEG